MPKSSRRATAEGTLDRIAGRALELISKITGRTKHAATGKAARARGRTRSAKGSAKRHAGR